jgi:hypothetical protein
MRGSFMLTALATLAATAAQSARPPEPNPRGQAALAKLIADKTAGKPINCINLSDIRSTQVLDGTAIVYQVGGGKLYVNRPEIGGESLDSDDILVTRTSSNQLCRIDTVRLVARGSLFERGFVGLGDFVPYSKP